MIPLTNHDSQGSGGQWGPDQIYPDQWQQGWFLPWVFYHHFFLVYPADAQKNSSIFWMSLRQKIEGLAVHDPIERIKRQRT